jgi:hypothetical protein
MRPLRERKEVNYCEDAEVATAREDAKQSILSFAFRKGEDKSGPSDR